jgi:Helix-turn-helix of DDE superfamily endonuclease
MRHHEGNVLPSQANREGLRASPLNWVECDNCPLPTPEDRLFFLLTYLKTYALQVVQGRLFGMGQSKANQWIHVLLPALRTLGDAPTRSLAALAQRLGEEITNELVACFANWPKLL